VNRLEYRFTAYLFYMFTSAFAVPIIHAFWLIALTRPECGGVTAYILRSAPFQFFGWISYSVYCIHAPLFHWAAWAYAGHMSPDAVPMILRTHDFFVCGSTRPPAGMKTSSLLDFHVVRWMLARAMQVRA